MTTQVFEKLSLTIQKKESSFNKKEFREKIDIEALNRLIGSDLLRVFEEEDGVITKYWMEHYKNEKNLLIAYRKKYKSFKTKEGYVPVKYESKGSNYGRVYPDKSLSLCSFRKAIRHTLAKDYYEDIDIKNCHPVILLQICQSNGIMTPNLQSYVEQRREILDIFSKKYKCDEEEIKTLFISIMYGAGVQKWYRDHNIPPEEEDAFFSRFKEEIDRIATFVVNSNPEMTKELKKRDKAYNEKGRILSYFCQDWERRILEVVYEYLCFKDVVKDNAVLCFDGLMIPKDKYNPDLLVELSNEVFNRLSLRVEFVNKEMNMFYTPEQLPATIPTASSSNTTNVELDSSETERLNVMYLQSLETYEEKKAYWELFACKIIFPEPIFIIESYTESFTQKKKEDKTLLFTHDQLYKAFEHISITETREDGTEKKTEFIKRWIKDENIRVYQNMVFEPENRIGKKHQEGINYNLFAGYNDCIREELVNMESLRVFHMIGKELCGGDQEHYEYLLKYFAYKIQFPNKKIPLSIIIRGKQGTGKNIWFNLMMSLIHKSNYLSTAEPDDLFGTHAEGWFRKLFVNINECEGGKTFDYEGKIKSAITEDKATCNPKHLRPFEVDLFALLIIFSNKINPIPIDVRSKDRRFIVFETTDHFLNKNKYTSVNWWIPATKLATNPVFISSLYYYLNSLDVEHYDFIANRPITKAYKEMCAQFIPAEAQFFEKFISNREFENQQAQNEIPALPPNGKSKATTLFTSLTTPFYESPLYDRTFTIEDPVEFHSECCDWMKRAGYYRNGLPNIMKWYAVLETDLKFPVARKKIHGKSVLQFNPKELYNHLLQSNWVITEESFREETNPVVADDLHSHLFDF